MIETPEPHSDFHCLSWMIVVLSRLEHSFLPMNNTYLVGKKTMETFMVNSSTQAQWERANGDLAS